MLRGKFLRRQAVTVALWCILCNASVFAQIKIMPLGDSITQGFGGSSPLHGYRDQLASLLAQEGISYDFVGTLADGSGFDPDHQGIPGISAEQLASSVADYLKDNNPDMVLLHIGTNDISNNKTPAAISNYIKSIVDALYRHNNSVRILLCGLVPRKDSAVLDQKTRELNELLHALVLQKWEDGYNIRFVDQYGAFTSNGSWQTQYMKDALHPNNAGYNQMAAAYFAIVQQAMAPALNFEVSDDFNRSGPGLGANWAAHSAYKIVSGQMANTSTEDAWGQMATWTAGVNPRSVSFAWGSGADASGINEGGLALRLSAPSANASGYLVWLTTAEKNINLWTIENGAPSSSIETVAYSQPEPVAGDIFKVVLRSDANSHYFDCYVNDILYGRVRDADKTQGNGAETYAGVMLKGNLNNDIDDFSFTVGDGSDDVPPAATTDLTVQAAGPRSVTLQWTAPGDDDTIGAAAEYFVRYSIVPINADNFDAAAVAPNSIFPAEAGTVETMTVSGLNPETLYYFALRTKDEAGNLSDVSNLVSATTGADFSSGDDFERADLGPDWTAHPAYKIVNGELRNTSTQDSWNFLAVYNAKKNAVEVSFTWGLTADGEGIDEGGLALMLNDAATNASGYLLWRRAGNIELWTIVNGAPEASVNSVSGSQSSLSAGDEMKVVLRTNASGHHFDLFINNQLDGTVSDPGKLQGTAPILYSGVMLHGKRKNPIDNFTVTPKAGGGAQLIYISGDGQIGAPGEQLAKPFVVGVTDENGIPTQGFPITFVVTAGEGTVSEPQPALTDANGRAKTFLTLGTTQALHTVEARGNNLAGSPLIFRATTKAGNPVNLVKVAGDGQTGFAGQILPTPIQVQVTDELGTGVPNRPVTFTVTSGGGNVNQSQTSATVNTNNQGIAQISWKIGSQTNAVNTLQASSNFGGSPLVGSPVSFSASAILGFTVVDSFSRAELGPTWTTHPAFKIVNGELRNTSTQNSWNFLAVYNAKRNPKEVGFKWGTTANEAGIDEGGFALMLNAASTTANGYLLWRRPSSGTIELWTIVNGAPGSPVASIEGTQPNPAAGDEMKVALRSNANGHHFDLFINNQLDGTLTDPEKLQGNAAVLYSGVMMHGNRKNPIDRFTITATAGAAVQIAAVSGNDQKGPAGQPLANPFVVKVTDANGIPVPATAVTFAVTAGGGKLSGTQPVLTNTAGEAKTVLTLSTTQALNKVEARAQGLTGSPVLFSATAQAGNAKNLAKVSGDAQSGSGGLTLPNPIQVKVTDNLGTVVPNHPVTFTVTSGAGSVNQGQPTATVNTNAQGIAQVNWKLGTPGAAQKLEASSSFNGNALTGSPTTFTATTSPPSKVTLAAGNGQVGSINAPLPKPFEVIVKDGGGKPIGGYKVTFTVMEGNGSLNGKSTIDAFTNSEGKAAVTLTMGPTPRASNKVRATAIYNGNNLPDSPITFTASAVGLKNIVIHSGKDQDGVVGEVLPQPLKVKVLDSLGVGIRNQNIIFKVIAGGGKLSGTDTVKTVKTDTLGIASIPLTLGTKPVSNKVRAETNPAINGSPLLFQAASQPGLPDKLLKASKDSTSGVVNNMLPTPLMTKVTDKYGNPLAGVNVIFTVKAGGGKVNGALKDTVKTQGNGQAAATLLLGSTSGNLNNSVEVRAYNGAKELTNSPVNFVATATTSGASVMSIQGGGRQDGSAGEPVTNLLSVKVIDAFKNGVAKHPVKFEIKRGGGNFGNPAKKDSTVITDATGVVKIRWTLGKTIKPDSQVVHATSNDGVNPLRTSPLKFVAFAKAGLPSVEGSFVQAGAASILANGVANSQITVNVRDKLGNPVAGAPVIIMVSGEGNNVKQPTNPTDAQGKATGSFTTTRSGTKTVTAKIIGGIDIIRSAEVQARSLEASGVSPAGGNSQTGNTNAALPLPMKVQVYDRNGNGVPDYEVSLKVEQGGGKLFDTVSSQLVDSLRVQMNASGFAEIYYVCGPTPMENRIRVIAPGLANSPFLFLAQAITPQPAKLVKLSGDKQEGTAGEMLVESIVARVTDANNRPVSNVPVKLSVTQGGGLIEGQRQLLLNSNVFGDAKVSWRLGAEAGLNVLRVESAGLSGSPVDFLAQSKPGNASALNVASGNPAFGNVNSQSEPLRVQTVDAQNNGVDGIPVIFELVEGGGTLTDNYVVTSNGGFASVKVNFNGASGWRKVRVSSEGLAGSPIIMQAFARPLAATSMRVVARTNNQKGTKGKLVNFPLQVKVLDGLNNPVPGVQVNFVVTSGGGSFNNSGSAFVTSDTNGIASAPWTLGATATSNQARAIKNGLGGSPFTFNATGFDNNFPIIDDLPDRQIVEGNLIAFSLSASDADNDPIRFGAKNLPPGAIFDSLRTLRFDWLADASNSAGRYEVSFLAYDSRGGVDEEVVVIDVQNRNRAPSIYGRYPVRSDTVLAQLGVPLRMRVLARDPDGDVLSYRWYVNGLFTGAITSTFDYLGDLKWNAVEAVVFDLEDTVRTGWNIRVPVELESFMATIGDGPGVQLSWKTGSETNNAGFNVLRSGRPNDRYAKLNEQLIPASREGKYSYADLSAEAGVRYYYKLEALDLQGNVTLHGPVMAEAAVPKVFDLMQNYPNPFSARAAFGNQVTHIRYSLPAAVAVNLTIYNSLGQEVRKLVNSRQQPGYHTAIWDGRDQSGRPAPSGIYYYRLTAGSFTANRKMLMAK
jgi:adhesin/invasin